MKYRALVMGGLAAGLAISCAGCVVHDGGKAGEEPAWWPAFVLRESPDPLKAGSPPLFPPVDTGTSRANPLNVHFALPTARDFNGPAADPVGGPLGSAGGGRGG